MNSSYCDDYQTKEEYDVIKKVEKKGFDKAMKDFEEDDRELE